jgi:DnaJ-class molecular chaperone
MSKAFATLGLPDTATPDEVKVKWRELCSIHHPDRGGNAVDFTTYRKAYNTAMSEASAPKACTRCQGTGRTKTTTGFSTIELSCAQCGGLGHIPLETQNG